MSENNIDTIFSKAADALNIANLATGNSEEKSEYILREALQMAAANTINNCPKGTDNNFTVDTKMLYDEFLPYLQQTSLKIILQNLKTCLSTRSFDSAKSCIKLDDIPLDVMLKICQEDCKSCVITHQFASAPTIELDTTRNMLLHRQNKSIRQTVYKNKKFACANKNTPWAVESKEIISSNSNNKNNDNDDHLYSKDVRSYFYAFFLAEISGHKTVMISRNNNNEDVRIDAAPARAM